jgi:predicted GIY-YIG superfamily endonuclease
MPYYVYALASTRREQYYIDMAADLKVIKAVAFKFNEQRYEQAGFLRDPCWLVWHGTFEDAARAQARAPEVRALPQRWQRRLVELQNPY